MRNLYVTLSFVMVSGMLSAQNQYTKTADKLLYHENTVRYRLAKIKEKLEDNTTTEFEFHQNLIMAVRIKLILATT